MLTNLNSYSNVKLVYGYPGDGKTHYIRCKLRSESNSAIISISVNEAFTPLNAIKSLSKLPKNSTKCAIFFNFTIVSNYKNGVQDVEERRKLAELMDSLGWFFYHLLILGYVEDPTTGISYCLPGKQDWTVYVEVPSLDRSHKPEESLQIFSSDIPTFGLLGTADSINQKELIYTVDRDVQLVCKYLKAYEIGQGDEGIDRLFETRRTPTTGIYNFLTSMTYLYLFITCRTVERV